MFLHLKRQNCTGGNINSTGVKENYAGGNKNCTGVYRNYSG
jgi:hypothetical protein